MSSAAKPQHGIVWVNRNAAIYRGFTITKLPRTAQQPRSQYVISHDGNYFGCEFAGAEAMRFIDRLYAKRGEIRLEAGR